MRTTSVNLVELPIADMQHLITTGETTSTELTVGYLNRLFYYDRNGARLNSTPLIAADALAQAMV